MIKRKLFLLWIFGFVLMFLMVGVVQASFTLQDENLATYDYNARVGLESDSTNHRYCQKVITPANSVDITQLEFYIVSKVGSFSAGENLIIEFGTSCGDNSLSSNSVAYSTLPTGAYNMTISDATVSTSSSYYITFTHENLDANEYIYLKYSRGSGDNYANGVGYRSIDLGGFGTFNWDMLFTTFSTTAPSISDFEITTFDLWDNSNLTNFTATIEGNATYSTTNGTIITSIPPDSPNLWNITLSSTQNGGYFNKTYLNYNVSTNLNGSLYQAQFTPQALEIVSNNTISGGNFTIGNTTINEGDSFFIKAGTYNVTFNHNNYYNKIQQFTITSLSNATQNITGVYNSLINLTAKDNNDNSQINNFYASFGAYSFNATNGFIELGYLNGSNITLTVWGDTYAQENYNLSFNQTYLEYEVNLWETGAIKVYVYDESTGGLINGTTINILNTDGTTDITATMNTSSYYTTINESGNLTITLNGGGYSERVFYEVMTTGRYLVFNAYLLETANSQLTTFQILNDINQLVGGAQLSFYKTINNSLERVAMAQTDFSGSVQVNLDNNALYLLRVTHNDYLQKEVSFIPTATSYQVYLTGTSLAYSNMFDTINYYFTPQGSRSLEGNTTYDFLFSISDSSNSLEYWGVQAYFINDSGGLQTYLDNRTISTGGIASFNLSTPINKTIVNATFFLKKLGEDYWSKNIKFLVYPQLTNDYTVKQSFEDYGDEISDLAKVIISVFCVLALVGLTASFMAFNSVLLSIEILIGLGFFVFLGWVQLWLYLLLLVPTIIIAFLTRGGQD